jgi:uncharacterized protein
MSENLFRSLAREARNRLDSWTNILAGFGGKQDKRGGFSFAFSKLQHASRWSLYAGEPMLRKVIDAVPDYALKKAIDFEDENLEDQLKVFYKDLNVYSNLKKLWKYARVASASIWILNIDDGQEEKYPVAYDKIKSITSDMILPQDYFTGNQFDIKDSKTITVMIPNGTHREIHKDRFILIDGYEQGIQERMNNQGCGGSYVDLYWEDVKSYNVAHQMPNILLLDFSQSVYKLKDLNQKLSTKQGDLIKSKLEIMDYVRSTLNAVVLDSEEEFQRQATAVTGIDTLIKQPERKLAAVSRIPHTILLGESPGGSLSQSGNSQLTDFYDYIKSEQVEVLAPVIDKLNNLFSMFYLKKDDWLKWEFKPLTELSEKEEAEIDKMEAETSQIYITNQVYSPDEVRMKKENGHSDGKNKELKNKMIAQTKALSEVDELTDENI